MTSVFLEHVNLSVNDPDKTAACLSQLFDWKVRWQGPSMDNGYTVHVGNDTSYVALYRSDSMQATPDRNHHLVNNLNHIAVVVPNFESTLERAKSAGLEPFNFREYVPGHRCFYLLIDDNLELEIGAYAN